MTGRTPETFLSGLIERISGEVIRSKAVRAWIALAKITGAFLCRAAVDLGKVGGANENTVGLKTVVSVYVINSRMTTYSLRMELAPTPVTEEQKDGNEPGDRRLLAIWREPNDRKNQVILRNRIWRHHRRVRGPSAQPPYRWHKDRGGRLVIPQGSGLSPTKLE